MKIKQLITGFLMACADSVPGVSGGTIAYIMGLYDKLIANINNLGKKEKRKEALKFLAIIAIGWIFGFIFAINLISNLIETKIFDLSSLFLGFTMVSIFLTINNEKEQLRKLPKASIFTLIGIIFVVLVSYLGTLVPSSYNANGSVYSYIYMFIAGFLAISFMLLPGVSGSTVLLIFGAYYIVISAAKQFLNFDLSSLHVLIPTGLGIIVGGVVAVKVIDHMFKQYRVQTLYLINGLLIGSMYAIIVGTISKKGSPLTVETFNFVWFMSGIILMIILDYGNKKLSEKA